MDSALAYMHEHEEQLGNATPKLHRDIKPDHLLLDRRKHLWLIDFGLARSARSAKGIAGTLDFMAPEQKQGNPEPRSDVYSLGKTFEHLTGQDGNNKSAQLSKQFKWLLKQSTDAVASKRPTAAWLANTIDQLIALRRARLQLGVTAQNAQEARERRAGSTTVANRSEPMLEYGCHERQPV